MSLTLLDKFNKGELQQADRSKFHSASFPQNLISLSWPGPDHKFSVVIDPPGVSFLSAALPVGRFIFATVQGTSQPCSIELNRQATRHSSMIIRPSESQTTQLLPGSVKAFRTEGRRVAWGEAVLLDAICHRYAIQRPCIMQQVRNTYEMNKCMVDDLHPNTFSCHNNNLSNWVLYF